MEISIPLRSGAGPGVAQVWGEQITASSLCTPTATPAAAAIVVSSTTEVAQKIPCGASGKSRTPAIILTAVNRPSRSGGPFRCHHCPPTCEVGVCSAGASPADLPPCHDRIPSESLSPQPGALDPCGSLAFGGCSRPPDEPQAVLGTAGHGSRRTHRNSITA